jgi:hypothetical protein
VDAEQIFLRDEHAAWWQTCISVGAGWGLLFAQLGAAEPVGVLFYRDVERGPIDAIRAR